MIGRGGWKNLRKLVRRWFKRNASNIVGVALAIAALIMIVLGIFAAIPNDPSRDARTCGPNPWCCPEGSVSAQLSEADDFIDGQDIDVKNRGGGFCLSDDGRLIPFVSYTDFNPREDFDWHWHQYWDEILEDA